MQLLKNRNVTWLPLRCHVPLWLPCVSIICAWPLPKKRNCRLLYPPRFSCPAKLLPANSMAGGGAGGGAPIAGGFRAGIMGAGLRDGVGPLPGWRVW